VYFDLTRTPKAEDLTLILGAPPSYIGYDAQKRTIPFELLRAIGRPHTPESESQQSINQRQPPKPRTTNNSIQHQLKETQQQQQQQPLKPLPRTILLHFDELDKADPSFLTLLLNFLETGTLSSTSSVDFVLPSQTRLIVVFTANYAWEEIALLDPTLQFRQAQCAIRETMEKIGIHKAVFGRVQHILPFFRLDEEKTAPLIETKICQFLNRKNTAYAPYFTSFNYSKEVISAIKAILRESDPSLGMREIKLNMKNLKEDLSSELLANLIEYRGDLSLPLSGKDLCMTVESYDVKQHDSLLSQMKQSPFAFPPTVQMNVRENILKCGIISLLMIRYKGDPLTCLTTISPVFSSDENLVACTKCRQLHPRELLSYKGVSSVEGKITFHLSRVCRQCKSFM
jgi:hypothetical protein